MTLQSSGAISLLDIATEFGGTAPHSLNEYYGAAAGVPTSGAIDFADFYGKSSEVTIRIYPVLGGETITNGANASDGDLNTFATCSTTATYSLQTNPPNSSLTTNYGEMYVKSARVYAKYGFVARQISGIDCYASHRMRIATASATVLDRVIKNNTVVPFLTVIVDDYTNNATINAKVKDLSWANYGFHMLDTSLILTHSGYDHTSRLYEMYYDLTLSSTPPV